MQIYCPYTVLQFCLFSRFYLCINGAQYTLGIKLLHECLTRKSLITTPVYTQVNTTTVHLLLRGVKFPQNLLTLKVLIFHLDAKNEEKVKKFLKISLALP